MQLVFKGEHGALQQLRVFADLVKNLLDQLLQLQSGVVRTQ